MIDKFWHFFHFSPPTDASNLAGKATKLATKMIEVSWVADFLPPSDPRSRRMLADVLKGYILAVEGKSGWKLEVDSRLKQIFYIPPLKTDSAFLLFNFPFRWPDQARIVATKKYKIGDTLVGLEGFTAPLTKNEEGILEQQGKLFSVGLSSK